MLILEMLELRHLQLLQAIAEEGGVTRASGRLHLTQSALSHQLRDAEERLGVRLFDRLGKRMVLTAAGERLLRSARTVLEELDSAERDIRRAAERGAGTLRLTTQCNTVYHWLPSRLALYQRDYPAVELQVVGGASSDPLAALLEGRIDLAIVYRVTREPRVVLRPLFKDEQVVVMAKGHRLARRAFVSPEDFRDEQLFAYAIPRETSLVFRDILTPAGVTPARVTHIQLTEAVFELVKAGLGIAVLARWAAAPLLDRGEIEARRLTQAGCFRQWSAAYRRQPAAPEYLTAFVELLERYPLPLGRTTGERQRLERMIRMG